MSILIKGMEMPKKFEPRTITIYSNGLWYEENAKDNCNDCGKAIEIRPHGRLIDADAIQGTHVIARCVYDEHNWMELCVTMDEIADMPTIIEGEEE